MQKGVRCLSLWYSAMLRNLLQIIFVFVSSYDPDDLELGHHLGHHGDGVKDVAFAVEDLDAIVEVARARGAVVVRETWTEQDKDGVARFATLQTVLFYLI